ncbi:hypothetical protein D1823_11510 [Ruegeria sp. AD91A]|nr:hypothetical protein D1823_11510 [Ruegeria sp. AD91A]
MRVLAHEMIWGSLTENETWAELEGALKPQFRDTHGGVLNVDTAVIDPGNWADQVYAFCRPRMSRRRVKFMRWLKLKWSKQALLPKFLIEKILLSDT